MKAITMTQPWASLVACGAKRFETRSWSTPYRGRLAIHAAKGYPAEAQALATADPFRLEFADRGIDHLRLPTGEVLAVVDLVDVIPTDQLHDAVLHQHGGRYEADFGDYSPGRFAWHLQVVEVLRPAVPAKGALGLWEWRR